MIVHGAMCDSPVGTCAKDCVEVDPNMIDKLLIMHLNSQLSMLEQDTAAVKAQLYRAYRGQMNMNDLVLDPFECKCRGHQLLGAL